MTKIILSDGECNFCDASVQFIIKRDPHAVFSFASLQSDLAKQLLAKHGISNNMNSIVLITDQKAYLKSSAALFIAKELNGLWKLLFLFISIPPPIRDFFYNQIAKNRYKWFGKKEACAIPDPELRKRFLS